MSKESGSLATLAQFNVLMEELLRGGLARSTYRPWEIGILLDLEECRLRGGAKMRALREYQGAVQAELEAGAAEPSRFADFLERRKGTAARKPAASEDAGPDAKKKIN